MRDADRLVPQDIDTVVMYDRPNLAEHIVAATLVLSGQRRVQVRRLRNDGVGAAVSFTSATTRSLLFTVNATSASTANVGLAEIEAYDTDDVSRSASIGRLSDRFRGLRFLGTIGRDDRI